MTGDALVERLRALCEHKCECPAEGWADLMVWEVRLLLAEFEQAQQTIAAQAAEIRALEEQIDGNCGCI